MVAFFLMVVFRSSDEVLAGLELELELKENGCRLFFFVIPYFFKMG